ncbi:hypothetical protein L204_104678 [Cryptococcus depauperatus]|nr:chromatin structure-remodeling complex subunit RSC9 [Cryptococcus depauperatus CBS 7855]
MTAPIPNVHPPGRPIAPLPHHHLHHSSRITPYTPSPAELYPGPRNRLFLALRSSIPSEVDWALPRLVIASFDYPERFKLETWVDSVGALREWPSKWLEGLEKEAVIFEIKAGRLEFGEGSEIDVGERATKRQKRDLALGAMPEWENDPVVEKRATNSLLVLRNASFTATNAKIICRASFLSFLDDFFALPLPFLQHILLQTPEPIHHILTMIQSIFPYIRPEIPGIKRIFGCVFPKLFVDTRDSAVMNEILSLMIMGQTIPNIPLPPKELIPHLLQLLVLRTPGPLLDLILDLLISLSIDARSARTILSYPSFPQHLKSLTLLLEHNSRPMPAQWDTPSSQRGKMILNPAGGAIRAEELSKRRTVERDWGQKNLEQFGGSGLVVEVGDKPPTMSEATKKKLFTMKEPARSIAWMHDTFIYSSTAQVLQVTFWHAYRDFFSGEAASEPLLSASEVIRNVSLAFPGASAKVWHDEMGQQKFVIGGVGFRKYSDEEERFLCLWHECQRRQGAKNAAQLVEHVQSDHLTSSVHLQCQWARCNHSPCSLSHLLTHLPLEKPTIIPPDMVISHPALPNTHLNSQIITNRLPPPLPTPKLSFQGRFTPQDARRHPTGTALLAALVIRNLARTLRAEIALAVSFQTPAETEDQVQSKKKHLLGERYGLPIPESVLKEEEKEQQAQIIETSQEGLAEKEREGAKVAFENVEERLLRVVSENVSGIGRYLGDAVGW